MTDTASDRGTFRDLGLAPALVERLADRGIETPTALQRFAVPLVRRENNLVARAGPGAGTLVAYGAPLLDRLDAGAGEPRALVLVPTGDAAAELAASLGVLAGATGHAVAALEPGWRAPAAADVLFAEPRTALKAVRASELKLGGIAALVVDGAAAIRSLDGWEAVETLVGLLPGGTQRVLLSLPLDEELEEFAKRHLGRAMAFPPAPAPGAEEAPPERGELGYAVVEGSADDAVALAVARELGEGDGPVVVFCRRREEAARLAGALEARGYDARAGAQDGGEAEDGGEGGDADVLLLADAGAGGPDLPEGTAAVISADAPGDRVGLEARHAGAPRNAVLLPPRALPHLLELARRSGFELRPLALGDPGADAGELDAFRDRVERALEEEDVAPYLLVLEPLFRRSPPAEVAGALAALLRKEKGWAPGAGEARPAAAPSPGGKAPAWVRLFVSLGDRDDTRPGEIVGAITGEAEIPGSKIGKIEIRDTFSLVEVESAVADRVIEALSGLTIRGRSVKVDYDRKSGGRPRPRRRERREGGGG